MFRVACISIIVLFSLFYFRSAFANISELDAQDMVCRSYDAWRGKNSSSSDMHMEVVRFGRVEQFNIQSWTKGDNLSIIKILSPSRNAGDSILVANNSMWIYSAKSRRTIKIPGSLRTKNWMGSDLSYDDIGRSKDILDYYNYSIIDIKSIFDPLSNKDRSLYIISQIPKMEAPVVWGEERIAIRDDFVPIWKEFYDQSGELIKRFDFLGIEKIQDQLIISRVRISDAKIPQHHTELIMSNISLDINLNEAFFTVGNMERL